MKIRKLIAIVFTSALAVLISVGPALAQDGPKQDMKTAGTDTKKAAKSTGHAVSTGTKKTYNKTASGSKTARSEVPFLSTHIPPFLIWETWTLFLRCEVLCVKIRRSPTR